MFLKKNIFLLSVLLLFSFNSWTEEVSCSSIQSQIDIKHSYYYPKSCYSFGDADVSAYAADFYDDQVYLFFEVQKIITNNAMWSNDWAYQSIKKDNIEDIISDFGLGNSPSINSKVQNVRSSNNKLLFYYRDFETSEGKGIYGGNTINKIFYTFGIFTYDKKSNLNEEFLSQILSSLKIPGVNQGQQSSIKLSGVSNYSNSSQDLTDVTTSNNSQNLIGQRTFMLNWENVGIMQGNLSYNEQNRTGTINFQLPNDNSNCSGSYALLETNGTWSFLCSNDSSATGTLQWNSSDGSVVGKGKDNQNNTLQFMVAGN